MKVLLTEPITSLSGRGAWGWAGTKVGAAVLKYELSTAATGVGTTAALGTGGGNWTAAGTLTVGAAEK